jgi:hypothetical protein
LRFETLFQGLDSCPFITVGLELAGGSNGTG